MQINQTVPVDGISNTKQAAVLATLGLTFASPGMFVIYDEEHPKSTGGVAHFLFETSLSNTVRRYIRIYDEGVADVTLDTFLEELKKDISASKFAALEKAITESLLVYGRKILENHQTLVRFLKSDVAKFVQVGGSPVYSQGKIVGMQNFQLKGVK